MTSYTRKVVNYFKDEEEAATRVLDGIIFVTSEIQNSDTYINVKCVKDLLFHSTFPVENVYIFNRKNISQFVTMINSAKIKEASFKDQYGKINSSELSSYVTSRILSIYHCECKSNSKDSFPLIISKCISFSEAVKAYLYLSYIVHINQDFAVYSLADGKIDLKKIASLTRKECTELLEQNDIVFKEIPKKEKYGCFYKIGKKGDKNLLLNKCFFPSTKDYEKYSKYLNLVE